MDDKNLPRVYELKPSGECLEYVAWAIGAKSQSTKTYMEKYQDKLSGSSDDNLILHGLASIKAGYRDEKEEMSEKNIEISLINEYGFKSLDQDEIKQYLEESEKFSPD